MVVKGKVQHEPLPVPTLSLCPNQVTAMNPNHNPNSTVTFNGPTPLVRNPKNLTKKFLDNGSCLLQLAMLNLFDACEKERQFIRLLE